MVVERLSGDVWRARAAAHAARVEELTAGHLERRRQGEKHPVLDFLFDYYGQSPARLARWHPGAGVVLADAAREERAGWTHMRVGDDGSVTVDVDGFVMARAKGLGFIRAILERTLERPPMVGCFGLHEWAMVYRRSADRRHERWPLRLGEAGTDAVVEAQTLRCSHFDATRFFTPEGRARNTLAPGRETMLELEQPGCVHAGMDLYRWAFKLTPAMPSQLVLAAFELACDLRVLDMRASPYDLSELGYDPVKIETPEGRREYAAAQRGFAERGNALRREMLAALDRLDALRAPAAAATDGYAAAR